MYYYCIRIIFFKGCSNLFSKLYRINLRTIKKCNLRLFDMVSSALSLIENTCLKIVRSELLRSEIVRSGVQEI